MRLGSQALGNEQICGLLYTVVHEFVGRVQTADEFELNCFRQIQLDLLFRNPLDEREFRHFGAIAKAGEGAQSLLRLARQAAYFSYHQINYVVRVSLRVDAIEIPAPAR